MNDIIKAGFYLTVLVFIGIPVLIVGGIVVWYVLSLIPAPMWVILGVLTLMGIAKAG